MPTVRIYDAPGENVPYAIAVLTAMQNLVAKGMKDERVRAIARELKGRTERETLANDFAYLKERVPYVPDPIDYEKITSAKYTVGHGIGEDCDGQSVAVATVLALQGIPSRFRVIAWRKPDFTHVLTVAMLRDGSEVLFDLTQTNLGTTYKYHNFLDGDIMPQIHAISDMNPKAVTVSKLVDVMTTSNDVNERSLAFAKLARMYPREMNYYIAQVANRAAIFGPRRIGDCMGDWVSTVLATVGNIGSSLLGVPGGGTAVMTAVDAGGGGGDSSGPPADPNRPGRSITDARSYIEELNNIYPGYVKAKPQTINDGANYASLIHVPTLPKLDQHIDTDHPGHLFASWDGVNFWITDLASADATAVGRAYKLAVTTEAGGVLASPNYYSRTPFSDGAERFDNIGTSTADASSRTAPADPQTDKSSAQRYEQGKPPMNPQDIPTQPTGGGGGGSSAGAGAGGGSSAGAGAGAGLPSQVQQAAAGLLEGNTPLLIGGGLLLAMLMMKK